MTMLGVNTGILMPKLKHQWRLRLPDVKGGEAVSMQVVDISHLDVYTTPVTEPILGTLMLSVEDDIRSSAMKVLYGYLFKDQVTFRMIVEILDSNGGVFETRTFNGCRIEGITFDQLSYAPEKRSEFIEVNVPAKVGNAIEQFKEKHPELEALLLALNGFTIRWPIRDESQSNGALTHSVVVQYNSISIEYLDFH